MNDATAKTFRARLRFDPARGEYRDGDIRYMLIRADTLMGLFAELPAETRPLALEAFARAISRFGGHSARTYRDSGAADPEALLRVIETTAPELGWGAWRLTRDGDGLALTVENSPFAAGAGAAATPVCTPIGGMLSAVGALVLGGDVAVAETECAATGASCCRFAVRPATLPPPDAAAPRR